MKLIKGCSPMHQHIHNILKYRGLATKIMSHENKRRDITARLVLDQSGHPRNLKKVLPVCHRFKGAL